MDTKDVVKLVEDSGSWSTSDFQARYFIVNSQVTNYRRVRQAILEIDNRIATRKSIERNRRRTEIKKQILERDLAAETDDLKRELILVDIQDAENDLDVYAKRYKQAIDEIETFAKIVQDIVPDVETFKTYYEENPIEERNYWVARLAKQATMDLMTVGRITQGNFDSIAMMPLEDQKATLKTALKYNALLDKGLVEMDKLAQEELAALPSDMKYIDEISNETVNLLTGKVQGEDL